MQDRYAIVRRLGKAIAPHARPSQYRYRDTVLACLRPGLRWLDVGAGHSVFGSWMLDDERSATSIARHVVALDGEAPSLACHRTIRDRIVGNVERLPFARSSFDLVTANMVAEHLGGPEAALTEIGRVLAPGGILVLHTPNFASPLIFLASLIPDRFKQRLVFALDGRAEQDVFPAVYRLNTRRTIRRLATASGFSVQSISAVLTAPLTGALGLLCIPELLALRVMQHRFFAPVRPDLIAVLVRRDVPGPVAETLRPRVR